MSADPTTTAAAAAPTTLPLPHYPPHVRTVAERIDWHYRAALAWLDDAERDYHSHGDFDGDGGTRAAAVIAQVHLGLMDALHRGVVS